MNLQLDIKAAKKAILEGMVLGFFARYENLIFLLLSLFSIDPTIDITHGGFMYSHFHLSGFRRTDESLLQESTKGIFSQFQPFSVFLISLKVPS